MHADHHCNTVQSSSKSCSYNSNKVSSSKVIYVRPFLQHKGYHERAMVEKIVIVIKPGEFWVNYFAKMVYSIAAKTCPLAAYRRFSQAKS